MPEPPLDALMPWCSSMRCAEDPGRRDGAQQGGSISRWSVRPDGTKEVLGLSIEQIVGAKLWLGY
jgi:hypothetical protein